MFEDVFELTVPLLAEISGDVLLLEAQVYSKFGALFLSGQVFSYRYMDWPLTVPLLWLISSQ